MYKLVEYNSNWADEMDVSGLKIMTSKKYEAWCKSWKKFFKAEGTYDYCIGTNEEIPYEDYESFNADFDVTDITKEEYDVLEKLIPSIGEYGYGFFPGH